MADGFFPKSVRRRVHMRTASLLVASNEEKRFDGMNMDVFATDQTEKRQIQIPAAQFKSFTVERRGEEETPDIIFCFTCYCAFSTAAWKWVSEICGHDFFAKFDQAQMELGEAA